MPALQEQQWGGGERPSWPIPSESWSLPRAGTVMVSGALDAQAPVKKAM